MLQLLTQPCKLAC